MNEEILNRLDHTVQSLLQWDTSTIMLSLSTEVTSVPIPIDIIETLGAESGVTMRTKKAIRYWFPPSLLDQEQVVKLAVSNAYTAIQPAISECARLITNQGGLAIANQHISAMREELYRYTNNSSTKKIERKHNEFVSLPAIEKT